MTTHTMSNMFDSKEKKIDFMKKYVICPSDILDAEYRIDYWGNSIFSVGPSEWDVSVVLKVKKEDVEKWTQNHQEIVSEKIPIEWIKELQLNSGEWKLTATPKYYQTDSESYMLVYFEEGIIYKRLIAT